MKKKIVVFVYKVLSNKGVGRSSLFRFFYAKILSRYVIPYLNLNCEVDGHKIFINTMFFPLLIGGNYEPFETKIIKEEVKKGNTVLDVGANIGYYTLILAKQVGKEGKVFAFEPGPDNFALLKKNIHLNNYTNVILEQVGVTNKTGGTCFKSDRVYDSSVGRGLINIKTIQLDDYFKDYQGNIDLIKMDIEGSEGNAIKGMSNILQKNENIKMITEFWPSGLEAVGTSPEEYLKMLLEYGFKIYNINEEKEEIESINIASLLGQYNPKNKKLTNLYLTRK
jgi:FkbM family methyltransferase